METKKVKNYYFAVNATNKNDEILGNMCIHFNQIEGIYDKVIISTKGDFCETIFEYKNKVFKIKSEFYKNIDKSNYKSNMMQKYCEWLDFMFHLECKSKVKGK